MGKGKLVYKMASMWFEELPEPYRMFALEALKEQGADTICSSLLEALDGSFNWRRSRQGIAFWREVTLLVDNRIELPELEGLVPGECRVAHYRRVWNEFLEGLGHG